MTQIYLGVKKTGSNAIFCIVLQFHFKNRNLELKNIYCTPGNSNFGFNVSNSMTKGMNLLSIPCMKSQNNCIISYFTPRNCSDEFEKTICEY